MNETMMNGSGLESMKFADKKKKKWNVDEDRS